MFFFFFLFRPKCLTHTKKLIWKEQRMVFILQNFLIQMNLRSIKIRHFISTYTYTLFITLTEVLLFARNPKSLPIYPGKCRWVSLTPPPSPTLTPYTFLRITYDKTPRSFHWGTVVNLDNTKIKSRRLYS